MKNLLAGLVLFLMVTAQICIVRYFFYDIGNPELWGRDWMRDPRFYGWAILAIPVLYALGYRHVRDLAKKKAALNRILEQELLEEGRRWEQQHGRSN